MYVHFIDVRHQNWKLREIHFWIKILLLKSINVNSKYTVYCEFFNAISELLGHIIQLRPSVIIHFSGFHTMIVEIKDQLEVVFLCLN